MILPDRYLEIGIGMPEVDIGKIIPGVDGLSHSQDASQRQKIVVEKLEVQNGAKSPIPLVS